MNYDRGGTQKDVYSEAEVTFIDCPCCNTNEYASIHKERGSLGIVKCANCGLIYVNPRLKNPECIYWGDADKYYKEARLIFEGKAKHHRDPNYQEEIKLIIKYKLRGKFLDIGTNMGFFLRHARGRQWDLYGIEPSLSLSEFARKYFGLNVKTCFLHEAGFPESFFDVVTMTDVFEHITEPKGILREIHKIIKPDGILFIKVPNVLFNLFKLYYARLMSKSLEKDCFDAYEHVIHYSQKTLNLILNSCGFKVIRTYIGKPIQIPVWHNYVGYYYQYPSPWFLDIKRNLGRSIFYRLSLLEYRLRLNNIGYLAPNIIVIARKK